MAYNKKIAIVTKEDAEEIVRYGFAYDDALYGEAIDYLEKNYPNSDALGNLTYDLDNGGVDFRVSQYQAAKYYTTRAQALGGAADKDLLAAADNFKTAFEARADMAEDGSAIDIDENIDPISADDSFDNLLASLQAYEQDSSWRDVVANVNGQVEFKLKQNENRRDLEQTLWETVKTKILVNRTLNPEWQAMMRKSAQEKDEWLREEIERTYMAEVLTQAGATKVKKPTKEEKKLGSGPHSAYIDRIAQNAQQTFEDFVFKKKKVKISSDQVINGAANAWVKLKGFIKYAEVRKQYGEQFVAKLKGYRDSFNTKMSNLWAKRWEYARSMAESFNASKWQTIADVAASATAISASVATGAFAIPMAGYFGYMALSGFGWPIFNKQQLELIRAKKANPEAAAEWKLKNGGLKKAWHAIFDNKHEKKSYWWRWSGRTVGAALFSGLGVVAGPTTTVAGMVSLRFKQACWRIASMLGGQAGLVVGDAVVYHNNPTAENKGYLAQSANGLLLSGLAAGATLAIQNHFFVEPALEKQALAESLTVGHDASAKLPEGANVLFENGNGGRAYELGNRVIFEENGKVAHNFEAANIKGYADADDAAKQIWAKNVISTDEAKHAEVTAAQQAAAEAAAASPEAQENEALIYFFGKDEDGNAFVPTEYSEEYGLMGKKSFRSIQNTCGKLVKQPVADALNHEAPDPKALYEAAVRNLAVYLKEHPDVAPGKNPLQVMESLFIYHRGALGHWSEHVTVNGEGSFDVSRQIEGRWVYPYSAYSKEMNAWFDIICDGQPKESIEGLDMNAPMEHLNEAIGEGNNNRVDFDCGVAILHKSAKKVAQKIVETPEQPTTREVLTENQQVVEAPTTREVLSEQQTPVENNEYVVRRVRYVNKGSADTQLGDKTLDGHMNYKGSYNISGNSGR